MMKYDKPKLTMLIAAFDAIQSSTTKLVQRVFEGVRLGTTAAYEADE